MEPIASQDSEGTSATGREVSEDEEDAYEKLFAVPDMAPLGATTALQSPQDSAELKSVKAVKRKPAKSTKKKMRAPSSEDATGAHRTSEELDRGLCQAELSRLLGKNPILRLLRPILVGKLTGPVREPNVDSVRTVRHSIQAMFNLLRDAGYALGSFDLEKIYDWDLKSWKDALTNLFQLLRDLVGMSSTGLRSHGDLSDATNLGGSTGSSRYLSVSSSTGGSDESVGNRDDRTRMPEASTRASAIQLGPGIPIESWPAKAPPTGLEDAFARMMQTYAARFVANKTQFSVGPPPEDQDEPMESVSSKSRTSLRRGGECPVDDPDDFFGLNDDTPLRPTVATTAAAPTATGPLTRV